MGHLVYSRDYRLRPCYVGESTPSSTPSSTELPCSPRLLPRLPLATDHALRPERQSMLYVEPCLHPQHSRQKNLTLRIVVRSRGSMTTDGFRSSHKSHLRQAATFCHTGRGSWRSIRVTGLAALLLLRLVTARGGMPPGLRDNATLPISRGLTDLQNIATDALGKIGTGLSKNCYG